MLSIYIKGNSISLSIPPVDSNSTSEVYTLNELSDDYESFRNMVINAFEFHYDEKITNISDFILVREMEQL